MTPDVRHLSSVDLREVWPHEALDFTPWLASEIQRLGEVLGLSLEVEGEEVSVGPFSADILAVDVATERRVVIENWLGVSDHTHMGQLLTYAAGLRAPYAVFVAHDFRPEHVSVLTWLNEISDEDHAFFAVRVKAVRIDDSPPAALFDVVVRPDEWQRQVRAAAGDESPSIQRNREWWTAFLPALHERYQGWSSARTASTQSWMDLPSGVGNISYTSGWSWFEGERTKKYRVGIYFHVGEDHYDVFHAHAGALAQQVNGTLEWEPIEGAQASRVSVYLDDVDPDDRTDWPRIRAWALDRLGELRAAFQPLIDDLRGR